MDQLKQPPSMLPSTPAFIFDVLLLEELVGRFQKALNDHWPNSILAYSCKTNSLPWLISFMRDKGLWAEVVSDTEYNLALALDFGPDEIVFNGAIKGRDRLRSALLEGSIINLDSKREVAWTAELAREMPEREFAVGLRVNWDLESRVPGESTAGKDASRFGFNPESGEFDQAIKDLEDAGVRVVGLHMHRNSFVQSLDVFRASASVASELITSRNMQLDWIDMGGGYFGNLEGSPTFDEYVTVIAEGLSPVLDINRTRLIVEPGASLVAIPLEMHSSVLDVKKVGDNTFITVDASRTDIDPLFRRVRPFLMSTDAKATNRLDKQVIGGFTAMEDDRITTLYNEVELQVGDRLVFYRVGGYTMNYQTMFIEFLPAVYARDADSLTQVRRKWVTQDFLQGNVWTTRDGGTGGSLEL
ncbi:hypothetical protein ACXZ66_00980 [Corynebacterium sp. S7]